MPLLSSIWGDHREYFSLEDESNNNTNILDAGGEPASERPCDEDIINEKRKRIQELANILESMETKLQPLLTQLSQKKEESIQQWKQDHPNHNQQQPQQQPQQRLRATSGLSLGLFGSISFKRLFLHLL